MISLHAFMYVRNEQDIIFWCVDKLVKQGIHVTVFDNWSTDMTAAAAENAGAKVIRQFGRQDKFWEQEGLFAVQEAAEACRQDWCMLHAADEVFCSTRPGETYREAVDRLSRERATFIDHETRNYRPVDPDFPPTGAVDFEQYFKYWEPDRSRHGQQRTWKREAGLQKFEALGHRVKLLHKRPAGEKLIRKHYPLRSPEQAMRKIFKDWRERGDGRYSFAQYREFEETDSPERFIWDPKKLECDS